jgi:hypothetical protein
MRYMSVQSFEHVLKFSPYKTDMTVRVAYSPDKKRTTNVYERRRTDVIFLCTLGVRLRYIRCSVRGALTSLSRILRPRCLQCHTKDRPRLCPSHTISTWLPTRPDLIFYQRLVLISLRLKYDTCRFNSNLPSHNNLSRTIYVKDEYGDGSKPWISLCYSIS